MPAADDEFQLELTKHQKNKQRRAAKSGRSGSPAGSGRFTPKGTAGGTPPTWAPLIFPGAGPWSPPTPSMDFYFQERTFVFAPVEGSQSAVDDMLKVCDGLVTASQAVDGGEPGGASHHFVSNHLRLPVGTVPGSVAVMAVPPGMASSPHVVIAFEMDNRPGDEPAPEIYHWGERFTEAFPELDFWSRHTPARQPDTDTMAWGVLMPVSGSVDHRVEDFRPGHKTLGPVAQIVMVDIHALQTWSPTPLPPELR